MMDDAVDLIDKFADKLTTIIKDYGPDAMNFALEVGRIGAVKDLLNGVLMVGLGVIAVTIAVKCLSILKKESANPTGEKRSYNENKEMHEGICIGGGVGLVGAGLASIPLLCIGVSTIANPFLWVGLFRPEVYLAAKALGL